MIGTFAVIFVGYGSIVLSEKYPHIFPAWTVPLAWGFIVCIMIIVVGKISGAHFNPAVSLAFTVAGRIPIAQLAVYGFSQLIGGVGAIYVLTVLQKS